MAGDKDVTGQPTNQPPDSHSVLFDLDATLYPLSVGILPVIRSRADQFLQDFLAIDAPAVQQLRQRYLKRYGTILRGLIQEHDINPEQYLTYIHSFSVINHLQPNEALDRALGDLPIPKYIVTCLLPHPASVCLGLR